MSAMDWDMLELGKSFKIVLYCFADLAGSRVR